MGFIYKITSKHSDLVYVGSTTKTLERRLQEHKSQYKSWKNGNYHFVTSFKLLEHGDVSIELIEECENLKEREGYWIRCLPCVNWRVAGRTGKLYYQDHKEELNQKQKQKYTCPCGGKYTYINKSGHLKSQKHQNWESKTLRTSS